ncbi:hypothetical protein CSQ94_08900 [Janthinobacterium sp. BJB312]|nr:hypothetical protein CSQ94_08900 [Janthinobacterium sp. BJB312]
MQTQHVPVGIQFCAKTLSAMEVYFFLFTLIAVFSFSRNETSRVSFFALGILLFLFAAMRGEGVDRDYHGYLEYYDYVLESEFKNVEPTFILIASLADRLFSSSLMIFFVYAFLGVGIKLYAINQITPHRNLALLVYYSMFFMLLEMTQIRVGVAAGFLLLCIRPILKRNLRQFLLFSCLAFAFHYSAIIIFPLYFLTGSSTSLKKYAWLMPVGLIMYYIGIDIFSTLKMLPIDLIRLKIENYTELAYFDPDINFLNFPYVMRCCIAYVLYWHIDTLRRINPYISLLLKIYFLALFIFAAFASVPAISSRTSELLLIVEIVLLPNLVYLIKDRRMAIATIIGICFAYLFFLLFSTNLLEPYF